MVVRLGPTRLSVSEALTGMELSEKKDQDALKATSAIAGQTYIGESACV